MPQGKTITVRHGVSILEAARKAGIHIATRCGGKMGCLMCKVTLPEEQQKNLLPPKEGERRKLGSLLEKGTRLSCQSMVQHDVIVLIPEDPLKAAVRKQLEAARNRDNEDFI
ncbi:2Fe-2S iron-sulfur cluster-binding protein [Paenibacillus lemnae]|nr:2Fe-2S iron-sulfur cluster-binding protein [Paenibacillus lemnae]